MVTVANANLKVFFVPLLLCHHHLMRDHSEDLIDHGFFLLLFEEALFLQKYYLLL